MTDATAPFLPCPGMRFRRATTAFLALIGLALLVACDDVDRDSRAERAAAGHDPIRVGLIWGDGPRGDFTAGAELAVAEINDGGGVLGRPLELVPVDATSSLYSPRKMSRNIARNLVADETVLAVIGHGTLQSALVASVVYEEQGVLFINPVVRAGGLNKHGFDFVFTTVPDNHKIGKQTAIFAFGLGYDRIAILSARSDNANEMATSFANQAASLGMQIVSQISFFPGRDNFRDILADLGAKQFDAVFLAADDETSRKIVRQSIEMNLKAPFLIGNYADILELKAAFGDRSPFLVVPLMFNAYADRGDVRAFRQAYRARFGQDADGWAALGYDAIAMLAAAMEQAKTTVPLSVASLLRYSFSWNGLTGRHSFDREGSIYTKVLDFASLENGQIRFYSPETGVSDFVDPAQPVAGESHASTAAPPADIPPDS